jgi:hypothetical protein
VNKITYPTGGYVRYVWGMNSQAEQAITFTPNTDQAQYECDMIYASPVVVDRYVSFDGVNEVQHQHFSYSTFWLGSNPLGWTSKQTIVTTYDLVGGTSFETVYKYSPVTDPFQPNLESGVQPQIPVESSVQYFGDLGATLLKTVSETWQNERLLTSRTTTYPNNQVAKTAWTYNSNEMETEQDDYDFGNGAPGSLLKATVRIMPPSGAITWSTILQASSFVLVHLAKAKTVSPKPTTPMTVLPV